MADTASWSHETTLEASPVSASEARRFVCNHLVDHRLLYLVDPVRLVASELATHALVHAQTAFTITLAAVGQTVVLTVRDDSGSGSAWVTDTSAATPPAVRGLELVDLVSLEWGAGSDGGAQTLWASFAMRSGRSF
jgi:hypothetical protein